MVSTEDKVYNYLDENEKNENQDNLHEEENENEQELMKIYELVDSISLSRQKKNISRDFADGVLIAEIIKFFIPKIVELHNYASTNNMKNKRENWNTLNRKVLKHLGINLSKNEIEMIINFTPGYIEMLLQKIFNQLYKLGYNLEEIISNKQRQITKNSNQIKKSLVYNNMNDISNSNKIEKNKYNNIEDIYKVELLERDKVIEELKLALENTEKNLKVSEDNKKILIHQLEVLKNKVRELGIY